ncbi:hypothetical protein ROS1_28680 [Roseibium sp. ROS1]
MPRTPPSTDPITVAFAREASCQLIIDCLQCAYSEVLPLDGFPPDAFVMDLHKGRGWRCPRCGGTALETRPKYPSKEERSVHLIGLEEK